MDALLHVLVVGILLGGIYGLVSIGLNLIFGVIRVVNFAHGELVMLGMYGAFLAYSLLGLDPYVSTPDRRAGAVRVRAGHPARSSSSRCSPST